MDLITLSLAKKYADRSIRLSDYGIDLISLITAGGGKITYKTELGKALRDDINNIHPVYAIAEMGGSEYQLSISAVANGIVCFSLGSMYGNETFLNASCCVMAYPSEIEVVAVVTTTTVNQIG